jgi:hypothetical protein
MSLLLTRGRAKDAISATILVGPDQTKFVVHEHLLTRHSQYFEAALMGNFKEAKDKEISLIDTSPKTFEFFVHWLYDQRLPDASKGDDAGLMQAWGSREDDMIMVKSLIHTYIFADQHIINGLQHDALNSLMQHMENETTGIPNWSEISPAFKWLRPASPLCRSLVDICVNLDSCDDTGASLYEVDGPEEWPVEFLLGVARRATQILSGMTYNNKVLSDLKLDVCDYHDHKTDEEKKGCKKEQKKARARKRALASASDNESESELER